MTTLTKIHKLHTFNEWLVDNGTRVLASGVISNSTTTVYTVPTGKVFYLTVLTVQVQVGGTAATSSLAVAGTTVFYFNAAAANVNFYNTVSFPLPIKLAAGETVTVTSGGVYVQIKGFASGYTVNA